MVQEHCGKKIKMVPTGSSVYLGGYLGSSSSGKAIETSDNLSQVDFAEEEEVHSFGYKRFGKFQQSFVPSLCSIWEMVM